MNLKAVADYFESQANFCAKRAADSDTPLSVVRWAVLADLYFSFATAILVGEGRKNEGKYPDFEAIDEALKRQGDQL